MNASKNQRLKYEGKRRLTMQHRECERLDKVWEEIVTIEQFMEWLGEKAIVFCRYETEKEAIARGASVSKDGTVWKSEHPYPISPEERRRLAYTYFDIDQNKLEKERRAILEETQSKNQRTGRTQK